MYSSRRRGFSRSPRGRRRYASYTRRVSREYACGISGPYIAVVAEKPKAGEKIAAALGKARKCRYNGIPYWIVSSDGHTLLVLPSAGHLFGPATDKRGFPVFEFEWRPIFEFDKSMSHLKKFYSLMEKFLPGASLYVNACDYDIEGSVIGYTIIERFGDIRRYKRMKFSSLSPTEIRRAYKNLEPPDTLLVEAGKARHEVDWLWGINVSRALMHAVRKVTGKRVILSAGRVQSPTMAEAARRWRSINLAIPIPTPVLALTCNYKNIVFKAYPNGWRPESRAEAREIASTLRRDSYLIVAESSHARHRVSPSPAFNLGDLQKEASRIYKFSPFKTQKIAEDLYLESLISYPRTNSQKLPPTIDYHSIVNKLALIPDYSRLAKALLEETRGRLEPVQGRKDDPAHPAIHPTGVQPRNLDRDHWAIYDLIVRRFLAAFAPAAVLERVRLDLRDSSRRLYSAKGVAVAIEGWFKYYHFLRPKEEEVPLAPPNSRVSIEKVETTIKWERNAPDLSRTALLKWMEAVNIGTEATRARIIEILFRRGYLKTQGGKTIVTDLGLMVTRVLEELFPQLTQVDLTRSLEEKLEAIRVGKLTRRKVVEEAKIILAELLGEYNKRLEEVGARLGVALGEIEPPVKCVLCGREAVTESPVRLCTLHYNALLKLREYLPIIAFRLSVSVEEALAHIMKLRGSTGKFVIDISRLASENYSVRDFLLSEAETT